MGYKDLSLDNSIITVSKLTYFPFSKASHKEVWCSACGMVLRRFAFLSLSTKQKHHHHQTSFRLSNIISLAY